MRPAIPILGTLAALSLLGAFVLMRPPNTTTEQALRRPLLGVQPEALPAPDCVTSLVDVALEVPFSHSSGALAWEPSGRGVAWLDEGAGIIRFAEPGGSGIALGVATGEGVPQSVGSWHPEGILVAPYHAGATTRLRFAAPGGSVSSPFFDERRVPGWMRAPHVTSNRVAYLGGSAGDSVGVWDRHTDQILEIQSPAQVRFEGPQVSPDERVLGVAEVGEGTAAIALYDLETGSRLRTLAKSTDASSRPVWVGDQIAWVEAGAVRVVDQSSNVATVLSHVIAASHGRVGVAATPLASHWIVAASSSAHRLLLVEHPTGRTWAIEVPSAHPVDPDLARTRRGHLRLAWVDAATRAVWTASLTEAEGDCLPPSP